MRNLVLLVAVVPSMGQLGSYSDWFSPSWGLLIWPGFKSLALTVWFARLVLQILAITIRFQHFELEPQNNHVTFSTLWINKLFNYHHGASQDGSIQIMNYKSSKTSYGVSWKNKTWVWNNNGRISIFGLIVALIENFVNIIPFYNSKVSKREADTCLSISWSL